MTQRFALPSSLLLGLANISDVGLSLVRGIVLAHLLSPEQFGLAITVAVVAGIIELVTDIGIVPLAIRLENADYIATLHAISVLRAVVIGITVALCGPFFSWIFHSPGTGFAYAIVGLSSVIRGFSHLDIEVRTRYYDYTRKVVALVVSQVVWTATCITYAYYLHDFKAMAVGVLSFMLTYVVISHTASTAPWRLAWNRTAVHEAWRYGRPLVLNGIATAFTSLGDRALAGMEAGLTQLAHYTALATSALLPRAALARYLGSVFTPHFVNARDSQSQSRVADIWTLAIVVIGGTFGLGFTAFGQPVTAFVYGAHYHVAQTLVGLVGLLGTIRYMACIPSPPALASGRNDILVQFTSLSMCGLALGGGLLFISQRLEALVFGMCIGELGALSWLLFQLPRVMQIARSKLYVLFGATILLVMFPTTIIFFLDSDNPQARYLLCLVAYLVFVLIVYAFMRAVRCSAKSLLVALVPSNNNALA